MVQITSPGASARLEVLDGMRAAAALSVVFFHYSARWAEPIYEPTLYPYGDILVAVPGVKYFGTVGVLLFFVISGFVIIMTLEHSSGLIDFAIRRVARLWPTMLVCATLSTLIIQGSDIASYYHGAGDWAVTPLEYISSIFFVEPWHVSQLFGGEDAQWVEGVYWTLWAEVRFYSLIGLLFLVSPRRWFLWVWVAAQVISTALEALLTIDVVQRDMVSKWIIVFQPKYLAWFSLGLCGYMLWTRRLSGSVILITILALFAIVIDGGAIPGIEAGGMIIVQDEAVAFAADGWSLFFLYGFIIVAFGLFLLQSRILLPLTWRPLVIVGLASYPLYLFHERVGMAFLKYWSLAGFAPWLGFIAVMCGTITCALLIHYTIEQPAKRALSRFCEPLAERLQRRYPWLLFHRH